MSISAHEDRRHRCHLCGKGFIYPHKLQEHLNTHTGDKPFKCKFCNAAFASSSNKRMHERAHLGIKVKQSKKQQQWIKKKKPWNQSTAQFEENKTTQPSWRTSIYSVPNLNSSIQNSNVED